MKVSKVYGRDSRSSHPPSPTPPHVSLPNFGDPTIVGFQGAGAALQKVLPSLLGVARRGGACPGARSPAQSPARWWPPVASLPFGLPLMPGARSRFRGHPPHRISRPRLHLHPSRSDRDEVSARDRPPAPPLPHPADESPSDKLLSDANTSPVIQQPRGLRRRWWVSLQGPPFQAFPRPLRVPPSNSIYGRPRWEEVEGSWKTAIEGRKFSGRGPFK